VHVEPVIQTVHEPYVNEDENHEDVNRSLLSKPKAQLEPTDPDSIERFDRRIPNPKDTRNQIVNSTNT
jgi:hypothetical protein